MTRRQFMTTALGATPLVAGVVAMSGCGDGQPARGSISAPRKGSGVEKEVGRVKSKAAIKRKLRG